MCSPGFFNDDLSILRNIYNDRYKISASFLDKETGLEMDSLLKRKDGEPVRQINIEVDGPSHLLSRLCDEFHDRVKRACGFVVIHISIPKDMLKNAHFQCAAG